MFYFVLMSKRLKGLSILMMCFLLGACSGFNNRFYRSIDKNSGASFEITQAHSRAQWREQLNWPAFCDDGVSHITDVSDDFVGVEVYDRVVGNALVAVICATGAYQNGWVLFIETGHKVPRFEMIEFPQFRLNDKGVENSQVSTDELATYVQFRSSLLWGNIVVDNKSANLRYDHFYRGGGGCGVSTSYLLFDTTPDVVMLKTQAQCRAENVPISLWRNISSEEYENW